VVLVGLKGIDLRQDGTQRRAQQSWRGAQRDAGLCTRHADCISVAACNDGVWMFSQRGGTVLRQIIRDDLVRV